MNYQYMKARINRQVTSHALRAVNLGLAATLTHSQWQAMMYSSEGHCTYCYRFVGIDQLQLEHIIPVKHGGDHTEENVTPSCASCNVSKFFLDLPAYYAGRKAYQDGEECYPESRNKWCRAYVGDIKGQEWMRIYNSWHYGWYDERHISSGEPVTYPCDKEEVRFVIPTVRNNT